MPSIKIKKLLLNEDEGSEKGLIENLNRKLRILDKTLNEMFWLDKIVSNYTRSLNFKNSKDMLLCLNSLIENNSNDIDALLFRGMIHYSLYSYNDALDDFNRILSISPNHISAIFCRGATYRKLKQCDKSLTDLNKSLEITPNSAIALAQRGMTYLTMKKYDESLSDINRSLEIKPNATFALICRGETYRMLKNYDEALLNLNRSFELGPDDSKALSIRGATYKSLGKYDEALSDLNRSLELEPDDIFASFYRGVTYKSLRKYDEALSDLNRSLELNPNDTFTLYHRGDSYRMLRKYDEALLDFNKSLELEPDDDAVLGLRGATYNALKKYDEALSDLNRSLEIEPNDTFALFYRGVTYKELKKYDEALSDLNRSLEIDPNDTLVLSVRGVTYKELKKYDEALSDFNKSLELEPDDIELLRDREEIYQVMRSNLNDIWEENEIDEIIEKVERISSIEGDTISTNNKMGILVEDEDIMTDKELKEFDEVWHDLVNWANNKYGVCEECQQPNTGVKWCRTCNSKRLQNEFCKWKSKNPDIDNFIQQIQLKASSYKEVVEWIPFDRLKDINHIDKGGFGTIFRSTWMDGYIRQWDTKNNEWIRYSEVDVVLKSLDNSAHKIKEFLQEVGSQLKFRDKWVIAIYGITKNPETNDYMMVMQYANLGSIRKLLNKNFKELSWKEKLDILRYIAYGLALIHKEGLMHKDFHSGNLVCTSIFDDFKHEYYITDFGLCKPVGYQDSKIFGVLPYVAPEVLRGGNYTQASDIYSFGIIMTEVLTSYPPYHNIPHNEYLAMKICQGLRPKIRCEIPQLLLDMKNRCLDAEPQKRPSAKKLYRILQKYSIDCKDSESEFSKQIDAIESSEKVFPIYDSMATHSMAIYTSRMLDHKGLSKPVNITQEASNAINDELEAYSETLKMDFTAES